MKAKNIDPSYLDLLFEGKNKAYGAYQLRKKASLYQLIGLVTAILIITITFGGLWWLNQEEIATHNGKIKVKHKKVVGYSQLTAPPPIEAMAAASPQKPKVVKQPVLATKKFLTPVVKPDAEVVEEDAVPTQKELQHVNPGTTTEEGDSLGQIDFSRFEEAIIEVETGEEGAAATAPVEAPTPPATPPPAQPAQVWDFVEQAPQFPGGQKELLSFLYTNLEYPLTARENGIEGTLYLKILIEADGSISKIEVLRELGGGCEEEAIRVVQLMPKWEPGIQNGTPVRVNVALPIKFKLVDSEEG